MTAHLDTGPSQQPGPRSPASGPDEVDVRLTRVSDRTLVTLFTVTSFLASGLLFMVQPMVGKLVLPRYGGAASVWNVCMLFFQAVLLLGYLYSHVTWRVFGARQGWLHPVVLLLPLLALPLSLPRWAAPPPGVPTALWLLAVLAASVALPFFVISTSAPLLQAWLSRTDHRHARDPYFLYAAGNAGSLIALLAYPFLLEPALNITDQIRLWSVGYLVLVVLIVLCALASHVRRGAAPAPGRHVDAPDDRPPVTVKQRLRWLLFAAVPSSLLLGVTAHVSTDIAAVPLLWVIPLSIYLLTFVFAFGGRRTTTPDGGGSRTAVRRKLGLPILVTAAAVLLVQQVEGLDAPVLFALLHFVLFAFVAFAYHGALADERPHAGNLTQFYLFVALGGVAGGVFNSLIAPLIFNRAIEYELVLSLGLFVLIPRLAGFLGERLPRRVVVVTAGLAAAPVLFGAYLLVPVGAGFIVVAVAGLLGVGVFAAVKPRWVAAAVAVAVAVSGIVADKALLTDRSFFGVYRVLADGDMHYLYHGAIQHGSQNMTAALRTQPLTYYAHSGPLGDVFRAYDSMDELRQWAAVGLGAGTVAAYGHAGDKVTFYELDQHVVDLATNPRYFTYLRDSAADINVVVGDGRLEMAKAAAGSYQLIVLDAFSSDAIPVHLLTTQAFEMYRTKLAPGGVLAVHITNRRLHLEPVVAGVAAATHLHAVVREDDDESNGKFSSTWAVLSADDGRLDALRRFDDWRPLVGRAGTTWTDSYSSMVNILELS